MASFRDKIASRSFWMIEDIWENVIMEANVNLPV